MTGIQISVLIPAYNEEAYIGRTLAHTRAVLDPHELMVVSAGSTDATAEIAAHYATVFELIASRGTALNGAAQVASGDVLLFLHADTLLPTTAAADIERALRAPGVIGGAFRLRLDDTSIMARLVSSSVNIRSSLLNSFYGDQAMFLSREVFLRVGGFRPWSVMEDLEILSRLRVHGRLVFLDSEVVTSARRHRKDGWFKTITTVWIMSLLARSGVPGHIMARLYRPRR
jgi:rSAM/selenodomain-associated transferase 2